MINIKKTIFIGGVTAFNYGEIRDCIFKSNNVNIDGRSKVASQYAYSGIVVCDNYGYIHDVTSTANYINLDSDTTHEDSRDDKNTVAVAGGISAHNMEGGRIHGCTATQNTIKTRAK